MEYIVDLLSLAALSCATNAMRKTLITGIMWLLVGAGFLDQASAGTRAIPRPLPSHPGNIFLVGETVTVPAPPAAPRLLPARIPATLSP